MNKDAHRMHIGRTSDTYRTYVGLPNNHPVALVLFFPLLTHK